MNERKEVEQGWYLGRSMDKNNKGRRVEAVRAINGGKMKPALLFLDGARLETLGFHSGAESECLGVLLFLGFLLLLVGLGTRLPGPVSLVRLLTAPAVHNLLSLSLSLLGLSFSVQLP